MNCFGALEGRNIVTSCPLLPKLALTEPVDIGKMPEVLLFVHCEGSCCVTQAINIIIIIARIYLRLVGLTMLSVGLHLALLRQHCPEVGSGLPCKMS